MVFTAWLTAAAGKHERSSASMAIQESVMQQLGAPQNVQSAGLPNGSAGTNDDVVVEEAIVPVDDVEPPSKSEFARAFKVSALPGMGAHICVKLMSNTCCKSIGDGSCPTRESHQVQME